MVSGDLPKFTDAGRTSRSIQKSATEPAIRGFRYPVELVQELLRSGMAREEILGDDPDLEAEDIGAVLAFEARR